MRISRFCGALDIGFRGIAFPKPDIIEDGGVEEESILRDKANMTPQRCQINFA